MKITVNKLGLIGVNCYFIETDKAAVVVDPGFWKVEISDFFNKNKGKEKFILLTHGHFDHISGVKRVQNETGAKIAIGTKEQSMISDSTLNLSKRFHSTVEPFTADLLLCDGTEFNVGDLKIKTFETPGHTKGSVCYLINDVLFSGDTLFFESFGRTDFPGGDMKALFESLYRLFSLLDGNTVVYPGHGESTTIAHEKENNPIVFMGAI